MNQPEEIVYSDEVTFTLLKGVVIIPLGVIGFGFVLALLTHSATLVDLVLPCARVWLLWGLWVGILWLIARGQQIGEKMSIQRMFEGEVWENWQFTASEWQTLVEAESNLISPKDEGLKAYVGAVYSSIFGAIFALILLAVGRFAVNDPVLSTAMYYTAAAVFLLLLGIGLFQPVFANYQAQRYERKALRVAVPHVWYAPDSIYHETLGYFSLKDLEKVTDQTRSRKVILFTLTISSENSISSVGFPFPVPTGCEDRASRLVHRYRQERLIS